MTDNKKSESFLWRNSFILEEDWKKTEKGGKQTVEIRTALDESRLNLDPDLPQA